MWIRRPYGSGQIYEKSGAWYGRWRTADGRRVNRRLGPKRTRGEADGLTRAQAEQAFRRIQAEEAARKPVEPVVEILTVDQVVDLLRAPPLRQHVLPRAAGRLPPVRGSVGLHARRQRVDRLPPRQQRRRSAHGAAERAARAVLRALGRTLGLEPAKVAYQSRAYPENVAWTDWGVVFGTVHVVGSNDGHDVWFGDRGTPETRREAALRSRQYTAREAAALVWLDALSMPPSARTRPAW